MILVILGILLALFWRAWNRFREARISPAVTRAERRLERMDARADRARERLGSEAREARGRFRGWVQSWRPPRR